MGSPPCATVIHSFWVGEMAAFRPEPEGQGRHGAKREENQVLIDLLASEREQAGLNRSCLPSGVKHEEVQQQMQRETFVYGEAGAGGGSSLAQLPLKGVAPSSCCWGSPANITAALLLLAGGIRTQLPPVVLAHH